MPPLPKRKISKRRRDNRRSHWRLESLHLVPCPQCHEPRLPHRACPSCGTYRGMEVISIKSEKSKKGKKKAE